MRTRERAVGAALGRWVEVVCRRPWRIVAGVASVTALLLAYTVTHLGVESDNIRLVAKGLAFRRNFEELTRVLPVLNRSLVVVVEADSPGRAREAADLLTARLARSPEIAETFHPGGGPFFERNGLLYLDLPRLEDLVDRLTRLQPVIAVLERDPSVAALADWARRSLRRAGDDPPAPELWRDVFDHLRRAVAAARADRQEPAEWSELAWAPGPAGSGRRQVVFVEPRLDTGAMVAARGAMQAVRAAATGLAPGSAGVRVRITGYPALAYEEMEGLLRDAAAAGLASFALAALLLRLALRSWRLVAASAITLVVGLVWTAAFAAAVIGHLNVISMMFGVLFIGLGVDFTIHLGVRTLDESARGESPTRAVRAAAEQAGSALALCAVTTAIGFYSFVPTDYRGVGELGAIAGTGMLVIFALSFTLFPALVAVGLHSVGGRARAGGGSVLARRLGTLLARRAPWVRAAALLLAVASALLLPRVRFDANVIRMRDPITESVRTFLDLLSQPGLDSPWYIDVLAPDLADADAIAARLRSLPVVARAITLHDWVPRHQREKLDVIADARLLLDTPPAVGHEQADDGDPQAALAALDRLRALLARQGPAFVDAALRSGAAALEAELALFLRAAGVPGAAPGRLGLLQGNAIGDLPDQLRRLRSALDPVPFGVDDLPKGLLDRMRAPDGRTRVQVFPAEDLSRNAAWARFADDVRRVEPTATGLAINLLEFGRVTVRSLAQASLIALVAISLVVGMLGRPADVPRVLAPLLWAAVVTGGSMVVLDVPLNFADVIVLPLLLGIGVDTAIHLVHRSREDPGGQLLATSTARGAFYSALTTLASFGTLALSPHRGMASLGLLLVLGLASTLVGSLVVLPTLLGRRARPR